MAVYVTTPRLKKKWMVAALLALLVAVCSAMLYSQPAYAADDETITIGTGTVQTNPSKSNWIDPYVSFYDYALTEQIYKASEIGRTGTIKSIGFSVASANTYTSGTAIKVYMGMTDKSQFNAGTNAEAVTGLTCVFDGTFAWAKKTGWETITLDTPFNYNDSSKNFVVAVLKTGSGYLSGVKYNHTNIGQGSADPVWMKAKDSSSLGSDLNAAINNTLVSAYTSPYRPNIQLTFAGQAATFKVTFDADGGTPVPTAQDVPQGGKATEPTAPTKEGYTFDGWYNGNDKFDFNTPITAAVSLKTKWVEQGSRPMTVVTNVDGATITVESAAGGTALAADSGTLNNTSTPLTYKLAENTAYKVTASKEGYGSKTVEVAGGASDDEITVSIALNEGSSGNSGSGTGTGGGCYKHLQRQRGSSRYYDASRLGCVCHSRQ